MTVGDLLRMLEGYDRARPILVDVDELDYYNVIDGLIDEDRLLVDGLNPIIIVTTREERI